MIFVNDGLINLDTSSPNKEILATLHFSLSETSLNAPLQGSLFMKFPLEEGQQDEEVRTHFGLDTSLGHFEKWYGP